MASTTNNKYFIHVAFIWKILMNKDFRRKVCGSKDIRGKSIKHPSLIVQGLNDADILWFRQPFSHFYPDADFQIACDHYWYDSTDLDNSPNGGFDYVKSNQRTIRFYNFWYNAREAHPGKHDQDVLNIIKFDPFIKDIGLKIRFLDTFLFGGFFEPSKDLNFVCTMHANCCIGIDIKMHDLTMALDDWGKYIALNGDERMSKPQTWTVPRICG
ncbi:hypothetical protein RND71_016208 [Anisodus tanguticus]|uniref:Nucleotide-diphospho-sugar transferase domain-containing protein n=1 Tax=Anisodus tanguticus TaxID=243964 RepID=A0AAE1S7T4_9SOLA|nr:hypothetical protein RND71_016208 [Anisodus tanguticus]